ncbi:conserved hypothetical protein [Candidatus Brocadia pituitae]|nr:conserved hypothetical protein [Candidatus Brocadia pituitae]
MKNKKVYVLPAVKGVHVLQPVIYHAVPSLKDNEVEEDLEKRKEEEKRETELKAVADEAYSNGRLDAEKSFEQELNEIKNRNVSLVTMLQNVAKEFIEKRERLWEESESEIIKLILMIADKVVGYEINSNSLNVAQHVLKDAISYAKEKRIIAVRFSGADAKKVNELGEINITNENIKFIEDTTISPGGCVIDTNFGSIDSRIETRWEEIVKTLSENKDDKTVP